MNRAFLTLAASLLGLCIATADAEAYPSRGGGRGTRARSPQPATRTARRTRSASRAHPTTRSRRSTARSPRNAGRRPTSRTAPRTDHATPRGANPGLRSATVRPSPQSPRPSTRSRQQGSADRSTPQQSRRGPATGSESRSANTSSSRPMRGSQTSSSPNGVGASSSQAARTANGAGTAGPRNTQTVRTPAGSGTPGAGKPGQTGPVPGGKAPAGRTQPAQAHADARPQANGQTPQQNQKTTTSPTKRADAKSNNQVTTLPNGDRHDSRDPKYENRTGLGDIPIGKPGDPSSKIVAQSRAPKVSPPAGPTPRASRPPLVASRGQIAPPRQSTWTGPGGSLAGLLPTMPLGAPKGNVPEQITTVGGDGSSVPGSSDQSAGGGNSNSGGNGIATTPSANPTTSLAPAPQSTSPSNPLPSPFVPDRSYSVTIGGQELVNKLIDRGYPTFTVPNLDGPDDIYLLVPPNLGPSLGGLAFEVIEVLGQKVIDPKSVAGEFFPGAQPSKSAKAPPVSQGSTNTQIAPPTGNANPPTGNTISPDTSAPPVPQKPSVPPPPPVKPPNPKPPTSGPTPSPQPSGQPDLRARREALFKKMDELGKRLRDPKLPAEVFRKAYVEFLELLIEIERIDKQL